jgi:eukaryotic-like serine/threonine-protein kinase
VSPDGRWLAYSAETAEDHRRHLFIRDLSALSVLDRELPSTAGGTHPFFSPDSGSIGYFSQGGLWRVSLNRTGEPVRIADAPVESAGGTWAEDGRLIFAPLGSRGLMAIASSGGTASALTTLAEGGGELEHGWPHAIPGGAVLFTVSVRGRDPHLEVLSPDGSRTRLRVPIWGQSHFIASGHVVYSYLGNLMAVKFDTERRAIQGAPVLVTRGVQTTHGFGALGRSGFAASREGTLIWLRATTDDVKSRLVRVTREGSYETLPVPAEVYQTPRLSPDGRRLAVVVRPGFVTREIRVLDAARPDRVLWSVVGGDNQSPAWMDNRRLTFGSNRDGVQKIYVVSSGRAPTPLFSVDVAAARSPADWTGAASLLALYEIDPVRRRDILVYRVRESIVPIAATTANERSPTLAPDGKWIAYVSDASGRDEIYIKPLDSSWEPLQMTSRGAYEPVWTREGLFFREGERMMLVNLDGGAPGALRQVFEGRFERDPGGNLAAYDVDRDGTFIMLKSALTARQLRVVKHWSTEVALTVP